MKSNLRCAKEQNRAFESFYLKTQSFLFSENTVRWRTSVAMPADSFLLRPSFYAVVIP